MWKHSKPLVRPKVASALTIKSENRACTEVSHERLSYGHNKRLQPQVEIRGSLRPWSNSEEVKFMSLSNCHRSRV